ncbi:hypothetical protein [Sphingobacterium suaedae]|uniref:Uncharacterized protein n=1 Tax=Sphingobacterium suaedae TaxID=1686402 RepID=A0ABW5KLH9_9SPHI
MKLICSIIFLVLFSDSGFAQQDQPRYWLFIHNNDCSYSASIDDMPVYTDFNDGSATSLSFPVNSLLLGSGKHILKLTLLPKSDSDFNLDASLSDAYSVKIRIVRNENKKDSIVLEKEYSTIPGEASPSAVHILPFDVELPYRLTGWQNGTDLTKEDKKELEREVVAYYKDMIRDYETKNFKSVAQKYELRLSEHSRSSYFDRADSIRLMAELKADVNREQTFRLEHYRMQFYGNGKVVALIRTDGEFKGRSAMLGLEDDNFYAYKLLLFRPNAGEPLQLIR